MCFSEKHILVMCITIRVVPMRNNSLRSETKNITFLSSILFHVTLCIQWHCILLLSTFACTTDFHMPVIVCDGQLDLQGLYFIQTLSPPLNICSNQVCNGEWLLNWQARKFKQTYIDSAWGPSWGLWRRRKYVPPKDEWTLLIYTASRILSLGVLKLQWCCFFEYCNCIFFGFWMWKIFKKNSDLWLWIYFSVL
jgi:hypothetical protein